jgi:acetyltransferase
LAALSRYAKLRSKDVGKPRTFSDVDSGTVAEILKKATSEGKTLLPSADVYRILEAYRIPCAAWKMANSVADAEAAANAIGYPVVLKADSPSVVHKSDMGGVAVNLKDGKAVREAAETMAKRIGASDLRFFIQKFEGGGREVIVGAKAEPGLGHILLFGLGGIYVEILKDVSFKIAPVTEVEAGEMIDSLKTAALLKGVRGQAGVDRSGIVDILLRVSQLVTDFPQIQEMDLNPVMAFADRAIAVDARMVL